MPQKDTLYGDLFVIGNLEANLIKKTGGTSSQFLKADGSVDSNTYLTSVPTLDQVTTAGNVTTNAITVGGLKVIDTANVGVQITNGDATGSGGRGTLIIGESIANGRLQITVNTSIDTANFNYTYAGLISFSTASVERMRIARTTGNLLINTTTDAGYKLDVNGTGRFVSTTAAAAITATGASGLASAVGISGSAYQYGIFGTSTSNTGAGVYGTVGATGGVGVYGHSLTFVNGVGVFGYGTNAGGGIALKGQNGKYVLYLTHNQASETGSAILYAESTYSLNNSPVAVFSTASTTADIIRGIGNSTTVFTVKSSGNVLINTTTDAGYKLDVSGTGIFRGVTEVKSVNDARILLTNDGVSNPMISFVDNLGAAQYAHLKFYDLVFKNDTTTFAKIFNTGNFGIGTTTDAGQKLQILGNSRFFSSVDTYHTIESTATGSAGTIYKNTYHQYFTGTNYATANSWEVYDLTAGAPVIHVSGPSRAVGINKVNASYQLDVEGAFRTTQGAYLATSSGFVGIGTTSPAYLLDVNGTVNSLSGYVINGTAGWTGTIFNPLGPVGQQNIDVQGGIIVNVY